MKINFKTVLLVHQNERELQNLSTKLIRAGYFIITEKTGTAALKILRRVNIDLVISSGSLQGILPKLFLTEIHSLNYINKTIYTSKEDSIEEFFQYSSLGLYRYVPPRASSSLLFAIVQEFFQDIKALFHSSKVVEPSDSLPTHFFQQNLRDCDRINISALEERI